MIHLFRSLSTQTHWDELNVLSESYTRILKAQSLLEEKNHALEQHDLAEVAHDLRTPLSSMHLALETLASSHMEKFKRKHVEPLLMLSLSSMVENLHQATRLRYEVKLHLV